MIRFHLAALLVLLLAWGCTQAPAPEEAGPTEPTEAPEAALEANQVAISVPGMT